MPESRAYGVLFLCTGNSARSILAEALFNHRARGRATGYSAGSHPTGAVHPLALRVLKQAGVATEGLRSKSWDEFAGPGTPCIDLVITVCDGAAAKPCPVWPGHPAVVHWGMADPAAASGDEVRRMQVFRDLLLEMDRRVRFLLSLPLGRVAARDLCRQLEAFVREPPQ